MKQSIKPHSKLIPEFKLWWSRSAFLFPVKRTCHVSFRAIKKKFRKNFKEWNDDTNLSVNLGSSSRSSLASESTISVFSDVVQNNQHHVGSEKSWVRVLSGSIWLFQGKASHYWERLYELKSALIWLILVSIDRAMAELQNLNLNEKFLFCLICIIIV